jgi:hypothetical protein
MAEGGSHLRPHEALRSRNKAMQNLIHHFSRDGYGRWRCVAAADIDLPGGRIQVAQGAEFTLGTTFMGIDVARLLEEQYQRSASH